MLIGSVNNTIEQQNPYAVEAEKYQIAGTVDKTGNTSRIEPSGDLKEPRDEYIPSDDKIETSSGLYQLKKDGNGRQKIVVDSPVSSEKKEQAVVAGKKKSDANLPKAVSKQNKDGDKTNDPVKSEDKKKDTKLTVNTDKVDAEIEKLKEKKQQIVQKLENVKDNEEKRKILEMQLLQIESELSAKDNDAYRKQNATYTNN